ncbi:stage III sporulation protein AG [Paenibacillus cymbidii]|uniref:stage III sporulation protein AG n=1 Tax=Paenibacillus cymbidii TaxID=1639034 RepID=UPI001436B58B|nr:stage III sporulation protein AG [Paenibacillus cymbidii]
MSSWKKLEEWLSGGPGGKKRVNTFRWLIVIGLVGVALMILKSYIEVKDIDSIGSGRGSPAGQQQSQETLGGTQNGKESPFRDYEAAYEAQLRDILRKIVGVGEVDVLVTIDSTEETIVQNNEKETQMNTNEKDNQGATRIISEVTRSGEVAMYQVSGNSQPIVVKTIKPKIRGVVVVAGGTEDLTVKKLVTEAVERGLDVPAHRISIIPRKQ